MFNTRELLDIIRPLAKNAELARILNLDPARISEIFRGLRKLSLDEAWKLVQHFNLDEAETPPPPPPTNPVSVPVAQLMVLHVASALGVEKPEDDLVLEVAKDLAAFAACVDDPQWKGQIDALTQLLRGMEVRRRSRG